MSVVPAPPRPALVARAATLAMVVAVIAACSGPGAAEDDAGAADGAESSGGEAESAEEMAAFCAAIPEAEGDAEFAAALRQAPEEVRDLVGDPLADEPDEETGRQLLTWMTVNCDPFAAATDAAADRRVAPLPLPTGSRLCVAHSGLARLMVTPATDQTGGLIVVAEDAENPYGGRVIGVTWSDQESFAGDGDRDPITVRGVTGTLSPITVFQQVIPDDLGQVVAWREQGLSLGVIGRGVHDPDLLLAVADGLLVTSDGVLASGSAWPAGWRVVHEGAVSDLYSPIGPSDGGTYGLTLRSDGGALVSIYGALKTAGQFEAVQLLSRPLSRSEDDSGRVTLTGSLWTPGDGPHIVTRRDPDGFVFTVTALPSGMDLVQSIAERSRPLDRSEWVDLVEQQSADGCFDRPSTRSEP